MQYPLPERIGDPELLVGREKEFALFYKWINKIPKRLSKSRVILARRVQANLLTEGISDIDYRRLQDGTLYLILRNRFEKEISSFEPDLEKDFNEALDYLQKDKGALQGKLNHLVGKFAEYQLATDFRSRKRFPLSIYFKGVKDTAPLNVVDVKQRVKFQRPDGKEMKIDVMAWSDCGRVVLVEVKKKKREDWAYCCRRFFEKV